MAKRKAYKPRDWHKYNQSKVDEGNIFIYFDKDIENWWYNNTASGKPGRDCKYSDQAIEASLTLRMLFQFAYRQTEGFVGGLLKLMGKKLPPPDSTTLCRRSSNLDVDIRHCDAVEDIHITIDSSGVSVHKGQNWHRIKHRKKDNSKWMKFHLIINTKTSEVVATQVTGPCISDSSMTDPLLEQLPDLIEGFYADGGYDREGTYLALKKHQEFPMDIIIPPIKTSTLPEDMAEPLTQRDKHIDYIDRKGRIQWESKNRYGRRNKVEGYFARFKSVFGERLLSRDTCIQNTEVKIKTKLLNQFNTFYTEGFTRTA